MSGREKSLGPDKIPTPHCLACSLVDILILTAPIKCSTPHQHVWWMRQHLINKQSSSKVFLACKHQPITSRSDMNKTIHTGALLCLDKEPPVFICYKVAWYWEKFQPQLKLNLLNSQAVTLWNKIIQLYLKNSWNKKSVMGKAGIGTHQGTYTDF
jgi:hypothetical protein